MTPPAAHGWTEQDYYRASRAARRAWDRTSQQLVLGVLDEADVVPGRKPASVSSSAPLVPPSPPNQDALDLAAEEAASWVAPMADAGPGDSKPSAFAASPNTRAPVAGLPQSLRDRSQKGA